MAIKESIGGWKENAHVYKSPRACSTLRKFLGDAWTPMMNSSGIYNATCLPKILHTQKNKLK